MPPAGAAKSWNSQRNPAVALINQRINRKEVQMRILMLRRKNRGKERERERKKDSLAEVESALFTLCFPSR